MIAKASEALGVGFDIWKALLLQIRGTNSDAIE